MPVVQDQNRITDALQGAVSLDITNALESAGLSDQSASNIVKAVTGSLAGGAVAPTDNSPVANKFTLNNALVLVGAGLLLFFLFKSLT